MRHSSTTCDWCEERITTHHVVYEQRHIGSYVTHHGARYSFDFCNDECMDAWRANGRIRKGYSEHGREVFASFSDDELAASSRVGAREELLRRQSFKSPQSNEKQN